jgi:hypothetical protein
MTTTRGRARTTISLALAGAATVGLTACGGGSSSGTSAQVGSGNSGGTTPTTSAAPAARPDACKLLTAQLAASVIGKPAKQSMHAQPNPQETHCQYKNTKAFVDVIVGPWTYVKSIDPNAKSVSGIGDDAEAAASGLGVRKGTDGMTVLVAIVGNYSGVNATNIEAKQLQLEEKLAKKLLPGL